MLEKGWTSGNASHHRIEEGCSDAFFRTRDARHRKMILAAEKLVDGRNTNPKNMKKMDQMIKSELAAVKRGAWSTETTKLRVLEYDDCRQAQELGPVLQNAYERQKGHRFFRKGMQDDEMAEHITQ
jgi:hypothetical protein